MLTYCVVQPASRAISPLRIPDSFNRSEIMFENVNPVVVRNENARRFFLVVISTLWYRIFIVPTVAPLCGGVD